MEFIRNFEEFVSQTISNPFLYSIFIIIMSIIFYKVFRLVLGRVLKFNKDLAGDMNQRKRDTLYALFRNIVKYIVVGIVALMILNRFGIETGAILAGIGIAGLVIGLALQDIIRDFLAGIFIIIDDQYAIGDDVQINGHRGEIITLGLKTTKIRVEDGEIVCITNRNITEVTNFTLAKRKVKK